MVELSIENAFGYNLSEMAAVGNFNGMYLVIFTNDAGNIPHFHIFNNQNPACATFDACIKLETPEYFKHSSHTDILNSKQIKKLIKFLKSDIHPGRTYWDVLLEAWNLNNSQYSVPYDMQMPDYNYLKFGYKPI